MFYTIKEEDREVKVINDNLSYTQTAGGQIARYSDTERHYQVDTTLSQEEALALIKEEGDTFNFLDLPEKEWLRCIRLPSDDKEYAFGNYFRSYFKTRRSEGGFLLIKVEPSTH